MGRTIRVFISSTFRDMHAERAAISRLVFPELRSRCASRGAEFIGVDLRWGVTEEETRREGALAVCLNEIEKCRPFFLGFLGDRYGYVPPPDEVPALVFDALRGEGSLPFEVDRAYGLDDTVTPPVYRLRRDAPHTDDALESLTRFWESRGLPGAGHSITAREILRGVFEDGYPSTHALFYLRNSGFDRHPGFPPALLPTFVEQDPVRRRRLQELKARIEEGRWTAVRRYDAEYAGLSIDPAFLPEALSPFDKRALADGVIAPHEWPALGGPLQDALTRSGTVALGGMEALAEQVLDDLWVAIEPELERPAAFVDQHTRERGFHERFVARQTASIFGRAEELEQVLFHIGDTDGSGRLANDSGLLVVTGAAGTGKSAFMAACARAARQLWPDAIVVPYFIGAAPESTALSAALRSLCESLKREIGSASPVAADPRELPGELARFVEMAGTIRPTVLVIDAVNQLEAAGRGHALDWLPAQLPPGTWIIVSALEGAIAEELRGRVPEGRFLTLQPLAAEDGRGLARHFLELRRKRLSESQLDALLDTSARPDALLPLYVLVALEELSLFGDHAALDRRIAQFPPTLPELFGQVLARLESDHTEHLARSVCSWLCASRSGLLESEILDLLARGEAYPRARWTRLYRSLEPYLKPFDEDDDAGGRLDFFHDQLRFAAFRRYLGMRDAEAAPTDRSRAAHRRLASRFRALAWNGGGGFRWRWTHPRALSELPFHLTRGGWWTRLQATLCDLEFVAAKCGCGLTYELIADYDAAIESLPAGLEARERERELDARLDRYRDALIAHARHPKTPLPAIESITPSTPTEIPGGLEEIRAFARFAGADADMLHRFGDQPWFCVQQALNSAADGPVALAAQTEVREWPSDAAFLRKAPGHLHEWNAHQASLTVMGAGQIADSASIDMTLDGRRAVAAGTEGALTVWDLETGKLTARLSPSAKSEIGSGPVALSVDGRRAYQTVWADRVHQWDLLSGHRADMPAGFPTGCLALSLDGRHAFVGSEGMLSAWSLATGVPIAQVRAHNDRIQAIAISAAGHRVVSGGWDGLVQVWDGHTLDHKATLSGHAKRVMDVVMTPDGRLAASAGIDRTVRLWDLHGGRELAVFEHPQDVYAVAITPDGRLLIAGGIDRMIYVWDVETRTCLKQLAGHGDWIAALAVTPDGRRALSSSEDGTLRLWDVTFGSTPPAPPSSASATASSMAAGGAHAIVGDYDGVLTIWNIDQGRVEQRIEAHTDIVRALLVSPDGALAWSLADDDVAKIWSLGDGRCLRTVRVAEGPHAMRPWPDGRHVVIVASTGALTLHDISSGDIIWTNHLTAATSTELSVSPDGRQLLLSDPHGGHPPTLVYAASGRVLHEFEGDRALLTPLGQVVAQDYRKVLRVWDAATGLQLHTWTGHDPVVDASGHRLFAGVDDVIVEWDLLTGERVGTYGRAIANPAPSGLTADGHYLISYGSDRMVRVWDTRTRSCAALAPAYDAITHVAFTTNAIVVCTLSGSTFCFRAPWLED